MSNPRPFFAPRPVSDDDRPPHFTIFAYAIARVYAQLMAEENTRNLDEREGDLAATLVGRVNKYRRHDAER